MAADRAAAFCANRHPIQMTDAETNLNLADLVAGEKMAAARLVATYAPDAFHHAAFGVSEIARALRGGAAAWISLSGIFVRSTKSAQRSTGMRSRCNQERTV